MNKTEGEKIIFNKDITFNEPNLPKFLDNISNEQSCYKEIRNLKISEVRELGEELVLNFCQSSTNHNNSIDFCSQKIHINKKNNPKHFDTFLVAKKYTSNTEDMTENFPIAFFIENNEKVFRILIHKTECFIDENYGEEINETRGITNIELVNFVNFLFWLKNKMNEVEMGKYNKGEDFDSEPNLSIINVKERRETLDKALERLREESRGIKKERVKRLRRIRRK